MKVLDQLDLQDNGIINPGTITAPDVNGPTSIASSAAKTWDDFQVIGQTTTITGGVNITTAGGFNKVSFYTPTLSAGVATTITSAATLYIQNAPTAIGSIVITNPYALWIDAGTVRLDGGLTVGGTTLSGVTGIINADLGFRISNAAAAGKILIGDGTNLILSTPTYPNAASTSGKIVMSDGTNLVMSTPTFPSAASTSGKIVQSDGTNLVMSTVTWPSGAAATARKIVVSSGLAWVASTETWDIPGTNGYTLTSDGTNWLSEATNLNAGLTANQTGFASDTYITGSRITVAAGDFVVGTTYYCLFHISKTAAGVAGPIINVRIGTGGTISDLSVANIAFTAGTANVDNGIFEVWVTFTTVGASAVVNVVGRLMHNLTSTGISNTGGLNSIIASLVTSSTFSSTSATKVGISFNGGASFSGTLGYASARLCQPS